MNTQSLKKLVVPPDDMHDFNTENTDSTPAGVSSSNFISDEIVLTTGPLLPKRLSPTSVMDITKIHVANEDSENFTLVLDSIEFKKHPTYVKCDENDKLFVFSRLSITTITVMSNISSNIDLSKAYNSLKEENTLVYQPDRTLPAPQGKRMFYNCMKWEKHIKDGNITMKVSSKVFPNGKFQYAGFKTMNAINLIPRLMTQKLRDSDALSSSSAIIATPKIVQINSTFYILKEKDTDKTKKVKGKWNILQRRLNQIIIDKEHISVGGRVTTSTFKPEKYPGINVKFKSNFSEKNITILIFATGSVLINGGSHLEDYRDAYNTVCRLVMEHKDSIITENLL